MEIRIDSLDERETRNDLGESSPAVSHVSLRQEGSSAVLDSTTVAAEGLEAGDDPGESVRSASSVGRDVAPVCRICFLGFDEFSDLLSHPNSELDLETSASTQDLLQQHQEQLDKEVEQGVLTEVQETSGDARASCPDSSNQEPQGSVGQVTAVPLESSRASGALRVTEASTGSTNKRLFRLQCSCRGDNALVHEECAIKWFTLKRTRRCDVCGCPVTNLPADLDTRPSLSASANATAGADGALMPNSSLMCETFIAFGICLLLYFCFFTQLLVPKEGSRGVVIALPTSIAVASITSLVAQTQGHSIRLWYLAALQFLWIILIAHLLYNLLNLEPVFTVILSTASGIALSVICFSMYKAFLDYRDARAIASART